MAATERDDLARAVEAPQARPMAGDSIYQELLRQAPDNAVALNLLGLATFQHGDHQQGMASVTRALELKPDLPGGYFNLDTMLQALKPPRAMRNARGGGVNPDDTDAYGEISERCSRRSASMPKPPGLQRVIGINRIAPTPHLISPTCRGSTAA